MAALKQEVQAALDMNTGQTHRLDKFEPFRYCSKEVRPRRPLGRDDTLDYEADSEDEWEEEPEDGEQLSVRQVLSVKLFVFWICLAQAAFAQLNDIRRRSPRMASSCR